MAEFDDFVRSGRHLTGIPERKRKHVAAEDRALDAAELRDFRPAKRHALLLCLIHRARVQARDDLAEMFIMRIGNIHNRASKELDRLRVRYRGKAEALVATMSDVVRVLGQHTNDTEASAHALEREHPQGGFDPEAGPHRMRCRGCDDFEISDAVAGFGSDPIGAHEQLERRPLEIVVAWTVECGAGGEVRNSLDMGRLAAKALQGSDGVVRVGQIRLLDGLPPVETESARRGLAAEDVRLRPLECMMLSGRFSCHSRHRVRRESATE